ncbi:MAG: DUF4328 domain-containing protein [Pseudonocardiaceae bacterium]|nr:DUF4328 domain-containing protein [Pseudonocardiaceae bacterium]
MVGCPRCGYPGPQRGPCPGCGALPAGQQAMEWVATPPPGREQPRAAARSRYTGPPTYRDIPRWGLPRLTWRRPTPFASPPADHAGRMRAVAGSAGPLLWIAAGVALLTAVAEGWRYAILLASRTDAVPADPLRASDVLVVTGSVMSVLAGSLAALVVLTWLVHAYATAAESDGVRPARPRWQVVAGALVPGVNLLVPGALLAEIEHAALGGDPGRRPRPSRLVVSWWLVWSASLLLAATTLLWGLRDTVQAHADGVVLHAATDVLAAAVAVLTAIVVRRFTALLSPAAQRRRPRMVVVRVSGVSRPAATTPPPGATPARG